MYKHWKVAMVLFDTINPIGNQQKIQRHQKDERATRNTFGIEAKGLAPPQTSELLSESFDI